MRRFSWAETRRYWETHAAVRAPEAADDADWLGNVCYPGAPAWYNRRQGRLQASAFDGLMAMVPRAVAGATALDVGCGTGRWTRRLMERGYTVTGIDLQSALVEKNRLRYPGARFEVAALQEFDGQGKFDVAVSVTVLQHNPPEQQREGARRLAGSLKAGGWLVVLENIRDQDAHVFSRSRADWIALFAEQRLRTVEVRAYDFSPCLRLYGAVAARIRRRAVDPTPIPESGDVRAPLPRGARRIHDGAQRLAAFIDDLAEDPLRIGGLVSSVHCGFLFRKD